MRGLPDRRPYVLLMPALSLLVLLLVVPIAIMVVFTFYTSSPPASKSRC